MAYSGFVLGPFCTIEYSSSGRHFQALSPMETTIGTFLTSYDIRHLQKVLIHRNILHCTKTNKMREKYCNGDYFIKCQKPGKSAPVWNAMLFAS